MYLKIGIAVYKLVNSALLGCVGLTKEGAQMFHDFSLAVL